MNNEYGQSKGFEHLKIHYPAGVVFFAKFPYPPLKDHGNSRGFDHVIKNFSTNFAHYILKHISIINTG